jgi:hypothetical protein
MLLLISFLKSKYFVFLSLEYQFMSLPLNYLKKALYARSWNDQVINYQISKTSLL